MKFKIFFTVGSFFRRPNSGSSRPRSGASSAGSGRSTAVSSRTQSTSSSSYQNEIPSPGVSKNVESDIRISVPPIEETSENSPDCSFKSESTLRPTITDNRDSKAEAVETNYTSNNNQGNKNIPTPQNIESPKVVEPPEENHSYPRKV